MNLSDKDFREAFKPIQIPAHYGDAISDEDKLIFALAQIGHGTASDIVSYLAMVDAGIDHRKFAKAAHAILNPLFNRGLINGKIINDELVFDLNKITIANDGAVDPDLLAPGLD